MCLVSRCIWRLVTVFMSDKLSDKCSGVKTLGASVVRCQWGGESWQFSVGRRKLAVLSWQLAVGSGQWGVGSLEFGV